MKNNLKRICAALIAFIVIISAAVQVTVSASGQQPTTYSKQSNSGTRDVVCTTLSGTSASSYYTGSYAYDNLSSLSSSSLKSSLNTLMTSTHSYQSSYSDCKNKAKYTDCQNGDGTVVLLYTSYAASSGDFSGNAPGWNREHVWPKSLGGNNTNGGGADLHHIRPDDVTTNSTRGNNKFGEVTSGSAAIGSSLVNGMSGGTYNSTYFEPHDNVKGDVARICLYVYVRWGSAWGADSITEVFQSVDVLLDWMELDPVDTWEMGRNEVVQDIQGNRNVFIDYPEYAWLLFGEEIPEDMVTPSGMASNGTGGGSTGGNTDGGIGSETEAITDPETETSEDDNAGSGTLDAPLTTTQAYNANKGLATGETSGGQFYVKGRVTEFEDTGSYYKNVYLTDGETELLVYTLNCSGGISGIEVGDTIVVHGYVKNYQGTIEMATGPDDTYVYIVKIESEEVTDPETEAKTDAETETEVAETEAMTETVTETNTETETNVETSPDNASDETKECTHESTEIRNYEEADCAGGYTGDEYCIGCGKRITEGRDTPPVAEHTFGDWTAVIDAGLETRECSVCGKIEERSASGETVSIEDNTETDTDIYPESDTEPDKETDTDSEEPTEAYDETETEDSDCFESEVLVTDPSADSEADEDTDTDGSESDPLDTTAAGCSSSLAGGSLAISVVSIAVLSVIRKKKE